MRKLLIPVLLAWLCGLPAWAQYGAKDAPTEISLSAQQAATIKVSSPLFARRLGRVSFDVNRVCLHCGDFDDGDWVGRRFVDRRYNEDYLRFLKQSLLDSGVFSEDARERLTLQATLLRLEQSSSVGRAAELRSVISSNATLNVRATVRYELKERDEVVAAWEVASTAASNSLTSIVRRGETTDLVLQRNLQALVLNMIASFSPEEAPRARAQLAQLGSQVDNTRTALSHLIFGVSRGVNAAGSAVGGTVQALAQNREAVQSALNSVQQTARAQDQAYAQATASAHGAGGRMAAAEAQVEAEALRHREDSRPDRQDRADGKTSTSAESTRVTSGGRSDGTVRTKAESTDASAQGKPRLSEQFVPISRTDIRAEAARCQQKADPENKAALEAARANAGRGQQHAAYVATHCVVTTANHSVERQASGMTASAQRSACERLRRNISDLPSVAGTGRSIRQYLDDGAAFERQYSPFEGCQCEYDYSREARGEAGNAICTYLAVFRVEIPAK
ncbi:MAG TPA: hypothetical protein VFK82_11640 [Burkholderiaceae bacterium]|nr:hypothetical protein [Burkholderiaceae bacterium]